MDTRFTDDISSAAKDNDFIVRKRFPLSVQIFLIFAVAYSAITLSVLLINLFHGMAIFYITLTITIGTLAWFTIFFAERQRDLVLATEFQNALLASATQLSTRFCLITKRDGSIVYFDPGFQKIFASFMQMGDRTLDAVLEGAGIPKATTEKIILSLEQEKNDRVLLHLEDAEQKSLTVMLSIETLVRPKGYFLLRGRDYVEKRAAEADKSEVKSTPLAQPEILKKK